MEMMRAVLDTNFWLATHVVTVTLGYASTFVAGILAIIYILRGVFTPPFRKQPANHLARMVYGIVCFATLFSFVGTVLGGIWADQSWGRFWGWDPKENGALLIVLWNAAILHARWGGLVRERGLMNMAVFGNIVTSFSWFGVNMLGIGLHSYGFMDAAFKWLMVFIGSQVAIILLGLPAVGIDEDEMCAVSSPNRVKVQISMFPCLPQNFEFNLLTIRFLVKKCLQNFVPRGTKFCHPYSSPSKMLVANFEQQRTDRRAMGGSDIFPLR
jgi:hypothetical protein